MPKQIVIEIPDWIDEEKLRGLIESYLESNLPDSATREEYIEFAKINIDDIADFSLNEELRKLDETRKKARERCQF